ncbi:MAG: proline--tRNA ligase [Metamycoplasmataceae bacterium]
MKEINKITPIEQDFAKWYTDVILNGKLIEYGPVKGTIIFRPNSYGIWENIQLNLNQIFKKLNIENVYLPMLIPSSLFEKEKEHVEGFAPELATITKVGKKELSEDIYIRPTSEVLFANYFKKIIDSYKDLPILNNQWANVLRWEKTTNPFLRNSEFLWQEGHTCHKTSDEAIEFTKKMLNVYKTFLKEFLAIHVVDGIKTNLEKFSGAEMTYTIEAMMKDGKALQCGTSHYFGQNFSKIYEIDFKNENNQKEFVFQSSWGISTRLIGAIIMNHGDNRGIIIPPKIAPIQVIILNIYSNDEIVNQKIEHLSNTLKNSLANLRVKIDNSDKSYGYKIAQSEIEGIPIRIEIGKRDLENGKITIVKRNDLLKDFIAIEDDINKIVNFKLNEIHNELYENSKNRIIENTIEVKTYDEFKKQIEQKKFIKIFLSDDDNFENKIKEETGATSRCILNENKIEGNCLFSNNKTKRIVIFAKSY